MMDIHSGGHGALLYWPDGKPRRPEPTPSAELLHRSSSWFGVGVQRATVQRRRRATGEVTAEGGTSRYQARLTAQSAQALTLQFRELDAATGTYRALDGASVTWPVEAWRALLPDIIAYGDGEPISGAPYCLHPRVEDRVYTALRLYDVTVWVPRFQQTSTVPLAVETHGTELGALHVDAWRFVRFDLTRDRKGQMTGYQCSEVGPEGSLVLVRDTNPVYPAPAEWWRDVGGALATMLGE